jgi:arylsulfatase A
MARERRPPNIVILFADDLGYGDLSCYAGKPGATPHLDRAAAEGTRWTSFLVSQPVCSASRTSLLTGCYANRLGIHGALGPDARHGLHPDETTIADMVKSKGYATACFGKWHLGHHPQFLPTRHGFDHFWGIPYSNDMWPRHPEVPKGYPPLPTFENERVVIRDTNPEDQSRMTGEITARALDFIRRNRRRPFFLYMPFPMPHVPLFPGKRFVGSTGHGRYADVLREIDASAGAVRAELAKWGLAEDTLFVFTSDNGPWLSYGDHAGSSGGLREGKGTVWEGGIRVPFVACRPGVIPGGTTCDQTAMTIDLLPTIARRRLETGAAPYVPDHGRPSSRQGRDSREIPQHPDRRGPLQSGRRSSGNP